ncbi:hypothetical protein M9458_057614 [Cirrhinus mrigala]|uniref:Uncharacterized protein n=1 Tax=Cirrhinus mrigala TaxID=683832 RepID=A0ABD0MDS7_CIRMR
MDRSMEIVVNASSDGLLAALFFTNHQIVLFYNTLEALNLFPKQSEESLCALRGFICPSLLCKGFTDVNLAQRESFKIEQNLHFTTDQ